MTVTATPKVRRLTPEKKRQAEQMRAAGMTYTQIGKELDVHSSGIWAALNPDRLKERARKRQTKTRDEQPRPRKIGVTFPWEGVPDDEYL